MDAFGDQDKARFVEDLQSALVQSGAGRYDHLKKTPFICKEEGDRKWIEHAGKNVMDITYLSLPTIALALVKLV